MVDPIGYNHYMILNEFMLFISALAAAIWLAVLAIQPGRNPRFASWTPTRPSMRSASQLFSARSFLKIENQGLSDSLIDLQNRLNAETQHRLEAERKLQSVILEKETLVKEIHHRVKNNLAIVATLLEMAARGISDPQALSALDNSKGRIMAMAMIHEQLYRSQDLTSIDLGTHIKQLAHDLVFAYSNNPAIHLDTQVEMVMIDLERAIPCGLIVNELITNALKYGYPNGEAGVISVSVRMINHQVEICVSDDGAKLPAIFPQDKAKSLGMDLVRILSYQLRASMDIQSDGIPAFTFRFPYIDPEE